MMEIKNTKAKIISHSLLISEQKVIIYLKTEVNECEVKLYQYNYEKKEANTFYKNLLKSFFVSYALKKIHLKFDFDLACNYAVSINGEFSAVILDPELGGILDTGFDISEEQPLGLDYNGKNARFKFWSPPAAKARLLLFDANENPITTKNKLLFTKKGKGIFELELNPKVLNISSLEGLLYQYEIFAYGEKTIALCPYAKAMAAFNPEKDKVGKAAIIKNPLPVKTFLNSTILQNPCDMIAYETHIRDFTIQPNAVAANLSGTYSGFSQKIPYLKKLGITHVQLMPINKCYTQVDVNQVFTGFEAERSNYNWGYDTFHYFAIEGRYSTEPKNPQKRIIELQDLANKLHKNKIGIIFDIVFNHTYTAASFENIAPGCYYRLDRNLKISERTGAGSSLESRRKSVRKFILDSLIYYVEVFGADGFRFDLMGFHDHETMRQIRQKVGSAYNPKNPKGLILHGEAWDFTDIDDGTAYTKSNLPQEDFNIGVFNDVFRDASCGKEGDDGFLLGNTAEASRLAAGIAGSLRTFDQENLPFLQAEFYRNYALFAKNPAENLNYLAIHDGLTLWDKINLLEKDESGIARLRIAKLAAASLFLSQGKIIWHGGDEMLRTKPPAKNEKDPERTFTSDCADAENGSKFFHENSYRANDYTNMYRWDRFKNEFSVLTQEMFTYVSNLIKLRREIPAFRYSTAKALEKGLKFYSPKGEMGKFTGLGINTFNNPKLKEFAIKFKNGLAGETYFLAGEVHKNNPNPIANPYRLTFDEGGTAKITFSREEIDAFDLQKWVRNNNLAVKLVKQPGQWYAFPGAYSGNGVNLISPLVIDTNFEAEIDLGQTNFWHINPPREYDFQQIVFSLDNTLEPQFLSKSSNYNFEKWLVIINASEQVFEFSVPFDFEHEKAQIVVNELSGNLILNPAKGKISESCMAGSKIIAAGQAVTVVGFAKF